MLLFSGLLVLLEFSYILTASAKSIDQWKELNDGKCILKGRIKLGWIEADAYCKARSARLITLFTLNKDSDHLIELANESSSKYHSGLS